ncbi:MAG TPA: alpha/beta fold hydrolase [Solirubrobacteraceae bacterium]|nr:alpha/beta fold hydrolase [Solirubrobacteraceae bacterium]
MDWERIRYAYNEDVAIAYTTAGTGGLDLLVIGGFVGHLEIAAMLPRAARFWERLASFCRLIVFDKRGMGLSDRDVGEYTLENVAEDALAVLDAVGAEQVAVFGISEGGSAATLLAAAHPERVQAMVQFGTYARMSQAPDYPDGVPAERLRAFWREMRENWGDPGSIALWAPSHAEDPEMREWWSRMLRFGLSPSGARSIGDMYEHLDVREVLPAVQAPTLVLYRSGDRVIRPTWSRVVADGIPGARAVELDGFDHLFCAGEQQSLLDEVEEFLTGRLSPAGGDRVLASVLFTDIVGSTERAAELGDARWREVLERHDRLAQREVGRHRGRLIKLTGDGLLASFDGPARAVRAGLSLRHAAPAELGVELRVGVHTGECEAIGDDLGGIGVHIAARVQGAAGPGEVLVSSTVKDLVVGSGLRFRDRGEHTLKGVPQTWRLYAAAEDGEP